MKKRKRTDAPTCPILTGLDTVVHVECSINSILILHHAKKLRFSNLHPLVLLRVSIMAQIANAIKDILKITLGIASWFVFLPLLTRMECVLVRVDMFSFVLNVSLNVLITVGK